MLEIEVSLLIHEYDLENFFITIKLLLSSHEKEVVNFPANKLNSSSKKFLSIL